MRFILLNSANMVVSVRYGTKAVGNEIASANGNVGQVRQPDGTFKTPTSPPAEPEPDYGEQITALEARWLYDSMMKDLAIEEANATQADLLYQLMLKGVL